MAEHEKGAARNDAGAQCIDGNKREIGGQVEPLADGDECWIARGAHGHWLCCYIERAKAVRYCSAGGNVIGGVPTPSDARPVGDDNQKCCANHETSQQQPTSFVLWQQHGDDRSAIKLHAFLDYWRLDVGVCVCA